MRSNDTVSSVWLHRDARSESTHYGYEHPLLASSLVQAWTRLRETRGSKLRALSHTPGREFRLRLDDVRAVFTTVLLANGTLAAFVHLVEHRGRAYEIDAFRARVENFHQNVLESAQALSGGESIAQYLRERIDDPDADGVDADIEYALFVPQQQFFNQVLPFERDTARGEPKLVIGQGPPGSGKTIVGQQLVREARALGYDVDVIVPSVSLAAIYSDYAGGLTNDGSQPKLRVHRFDEYFSTVAGRPISVQRESALRSWWAGICSTPRFLSMAHRLDLDAHQRDSMLVTLVDVLLEDDDWRNRFTRRGSSAKHHAARKDFLSSDFHRLESALFALVPMLQEALEIANDATESIVTRANLAAAAAAASSADTTHRKGQRLILVDEAQDLAPSEWRAILSIAFGSRKDDEQLLNVDWRVVLLGDMRQRVSLVPFDWGDVSRYVVETGLLPSSLIAVGQVDQASYRMQREVGRAAQSVFASELVAGGHFRSHGQFEVDSLEPGGSVSVIVSNHAWSSIVSIASRVSIDVDGGERLIVVHQESTERSLWLGEARVIADSVRGAKGLEYDAVVVLCRSDWRRRRKEAGLTGEEATELYTAISRARQRVLLVIPPSLWELISRVDPWRNLAPDNAPTESSIRRAFEAHSIQMSADRLMEVLQSAIGRLCEDGGGESDWLDRLVDRLDRLTAIPQFDSIDAAFGLVRSGIQLVGVSAPRYQQLQDFTMSGRNNSPARITCAALLLLGESAMACQWARMHSSQRALGAWDADALELFAMESPMQSALLDQMGASLEFEWTADRYERDLVASVNSRVASLARSAPTFREPIQ